MARLADDVIQVLKHHTQIDAVKRTVRITADLDPDLYGRVAAVLVGLGGKYAGKRESGSGRHAFKADPGPLLDLVLATGEDNPGDFYATPEALADYMAACLDVGSLPAGAVVLEPSYGTGALARAVSRAALAAGAGVRVIGVEANPGLAARAAHPVTCADVLSLDAPPEPICAAVMNPPFGKRAQGPDDWSDKDVYIRHILKVWSWLPPLGRLVAVAPTGWTFRGQGRPATLPERLDGSTRLTVPQFRAFVERYGAHVETRGGLFEGTAIPVTVIRLRKVAGIAEALPPLPADLAKPERQLSPKQQRQQELVEEGPEALIARIQANEHDMQRILQELKESLGEALGAAAGLARDLSEAPPTPRCPGCGGRPPAAEQGLEDVAGRAWHLACARLALGQVERATAMPAMPVVGRARRGRRVAEDQLVLEF